MPRLIIAVYDALANDIQGPIQLYPHAAPAIRFFGDILNHPDSQLAKHINDYQLISLGTIDDDQIITPHREVIITGAQWKAAQQTINLEGTANGGI